jgi:hypothetical protein
MMLQTVLTLGLAAAFISPNILCMELVTRITAAVASAAAVHRHLQPALI